MHCRPPLFNKSACLIPIVAFCVFAAGILPLASQTTEESGETSSPPASVLIDETTLEQKSVFDLSELTRKMVLRGTRHASISASIGGKVVPLENKKPIKDYPGSSTDGGWYIDPFGGFAYTAFRESYDYRFDFGNGVVKNLRVVPVRMFNGSPDSPTGGYRDNILLDLAYAGEVEIEGVGYEVEVVQGASPEFKDRLKYPGYFDNADVNVLLYRIDNGELVGGIGRLKKINGNWYEFLSNASGEKLTINRITATGRIRIDTGSFPQVDFAFTSGRFESPSGWAISLKDLDFSDGVEELPAGDYTFSEFFVRNNGQRLQFVWHPDFGRSNGSITVPAGGEVDMKIGRNAEIEFGFDPRYTTEVNTFYYPEWLHFRVFDADLGGAVVAPDSQPYVSAYTNSNGDPLDVKWSLKPCGWDGKWWCLSENRDFPKIGNPILAIDPNPPAVNDTRKVTMTCRFKAFFGEVSKTIETKVRNETYRLHGRFYDFDEPLEDFPDFDNIAPDLELPNARMGAGATGPWTGLPQGMADTFAACYEFEFKAHSRLRFDMKLGGGAARVYLNGKLIMDHQNFDNLIKEFFTEDLYPEEDGYRRIRVEYYHNTGAASLSLKAQALVPMLGTIVTYNYQLDPAAGNRFISINPVYIPASIDVSTGWRGGKTFVLRGKATSADGIAKVEYFVDGALAATTDGPDVNASLTSVNLDSEVVLRSVDVNGFGTLFKVPVEGESLEEWMDRYGLSNPDADADGDGVSNREEYLAGTVPLPPPPFEFQGPTLDGNKLALRWVGDKPGSKLVESYQVEVSEDLKTWKPHGSRLSLREDGLYSVEIPTGNSGNKIFFRVAADER